MKRTLSILRATLAPITCLALLLAPLHLQAAKNGNGGNTSSGTGSTGNSGGNGNNMSPTGASGTGHIVLGAPGAGLDYASVNKAPFSQVSDIGLYYKFEFTGIEVQCDADGVEGSYSYSDHMWDRAAKNNSGHGNNCDGVDSDNSGVGDGGPNGVDDPSGDVDDEWCNHMGDHDGDGTLNHSDSDYNGAHYVYGWWAMWAKVNDQQLGNLTFTSSTLHELSPTKRMYFSTPVIFWAQNITLEWSGDGNSNDPNGHFYILGSAIKEPPVPHGELNFAQTFYQEGTTPQYSWDIERE